MRRETSVECLGEQARSRPGIPPSGFIFHMSRCGSTLVSQMLAAAPGNVVVSEASPIDAVLRARTSGPDLSEERQIDWLSWMVAVLGQPRRSSQRHFFVKFDSWHTLALPLIRRAFPAVPWIFLYRDPVEVLVSQLAQPGLHMIQGGIGESLLEIRSPGAAFMPRETYAAQVLAEICKPVLRQATEGGGLLVNYRQLPDAVWKLILPHFGVALTGADRRRMGEVTQSHAKNWRLPFTDDSGAKQKAATPAARTAADHWLEGIYRRLEAVRADGTNTRLQVAGRL